LRFIVNTHFHGDHTGGNGVFGLRAPIVAHETARERLARTPNIASEALPSVTYADTVSLHVNGEEVRIVHFPAGHTDTDSVVFWMGSKVIHMGDHFFNGMFPFIDLTAGGTVEGYAANVTKVLEIAPEGAKVIPGHGPLASLDDLRAFQGMLTECIATVKQAIGEGKNLEAVRAAGLPEAYRSFGEGFISTDRWIATLYRGLGGQ
jgi:glyoxylase-like metal-dependent hydrolase (beta-lactamase superfamily II)